MVISDQGWFIARKVIGQFKWAYVKIFITQVKLLLIIRLKTVSLLCINIPGVFSNILKQIRLCLQAALWQESTTDIDKIEHDSEMSDLIEVTGYEHRVEKNNQREATALTPKAGRFKSR